MGYQALLFSPDEKLARVVSQVFTELDFTVEPAPEPFSVVKRLMAQHYDAVVVDCENEQNASLIFKSARNSSFNQGSLAIALVEGQAGVAGAYRIGANLVLTKPINLEQAKGTLRVARGLLRKTSDAAGGNATTASGPPMPASAAPVSAASSSPSSLSPWVRRDDTSTAPPPSHPESPESEAPMPAPIPLPAGFTGRAPAGSPGMTASAKVGDTKAVPVPAAQIRITMADEPGPPAPRPASLDTIQNSASKVGPIKNETARMASPSPPTQNTSSAFTSPGSGAAPAPARKITAPPAKEKENKKVEWERPNPAHDPSPIISSVNVTDSPSFSPSFAGLSAEESASGSGVSRKILIVAVIVALATLGYLGYAKLGKSSTATPAPQVNTPSDSGKQDSTQPAPALAPMSSPRVAPSPSIPNRASSSVQTATPKTATATSPETSSAAVKPPETRIALDSGLGAKKPNSTPLFVKSNAAGAKAQAPSPDSAPALPSPLSVAPPNDSALSGLMSSASSFSKPSLATPRVSQGVSQGLLIKRVAPKYPQAALAVHAQGAVQIEATINKDGNVTNLKVLSGHPVLAHAALEAVRQWRYKPYYLDGEPVEIQTQITVNFKAN